MPNKYLDSVGLAEYTTLIKTALDDKADLDSPVLTGTPTAPTPTAGDNSTRVATTAFVNTKAGNYLPLTGGSITGNLSVSGTITGDVTGDVTGNVNGNVTGNVTGTASGNLPLSGGTLTGGLYINPDTTSGKGGVVGRTDSGIRLAAEAFGTGSAGAYIDLYGRSYSGNAGTFVICANSASGAKNLTGKTDGTLTWNSLDISPQTFSYSGTSSDVSVPNNTVKNLFSFTLSKGTWLVIVNASFANHSTGYRTLGIATSTTSQNMDRNTIVRAGAANGANTNLSLPCILAVSSSSSTFYVNVLQTSGSSLNVSGGSMRFRLSAKA